MQHDRQLTGSPSRAGGHLPPALCRYVAVGQLVRKSISQKFRVPVSTAARSRTFSFHAPLMALPVNAESDCAGAVRSAYTVWMLSVLEPVRLCSSTVVLSGPINDTSRSP